MRGRPLVAILGATGTCVVAAALSVWLLVGQSPTTETAVTSVVIPIPDNPATLAATEAQEAERVAALPSAVKEPPAPAAPEPAVEAPPAELFISDAIRQKLQDPELRKNVAPADLAAVEAFYAGRTGPSLWLTGTGLKPEAQRAIEEIGKADEWGLESAVFAPPNPGDAPSTPEEQAATEIKLDLAILQYARFARGGRTNPTSLSKVIDQTPSLRDPKLVLTEIAVSSEPDAYLRSLHPKHEQFERLRQALIKIRAEADPGIEPKGAKQVLINMERWRWMPDDLGGTYVWLNVPEFMGYVVKDGKRIHADKIVVGKPVYATPTFSANMQTIVFNPEWTVPPTIVREDLLPKLRGGGSGWFGGGNTAILKQHKLKVRYKGREVDPDKIDWKNVNMGAISFTQAPGPTNVLGKVKFLYPNKHIVYMHDTIKRDLLKLEVRAEGHHCPRVANPGKFAAVILAQDKGWPAAKVDELMAKGYNSAVDLSKPVPVHTTYFTAVVDDEGKLRTFGDVYKLDAVVASAVVGRRAAPPAVANSGPDRADSVADSTP
ncbi:MAG: L,D-transpeptidase family protein [Methyloceanibacter sp.]